MSDKRLNDLETKFMVQEELLNELNQIVAKQQDIIDFLVTESKANNQVGSPQKSEAGSLFEQLKEERPPHY
jgi:SlyX protein